MSYDVVELKEKAIAGYSAMVDANSTTGADEVIRNLQDIVHARPLPDGIHSENEAFRYYRINRASSPRAREREVFVGVDRDVAAGTLRRTFPCVTAIPQGAYARFRRVAADKSAMDSMWSEIGSDKELSRSRTCRADFHVYSSLEPSVFDMYLSLA